MTRTIGVVPPMRVLRFPKRNLNPKHYKHLESQRDLYRHLTPRNKLSRKTPRLSGAFTGTSSFKDLLQSEHDVGGRGTQAGRSRAGDVVRKGSRLAGRPWEEFGAPRPAPFPFYQKVSTSLEYSTFSRRTSAFKKW